MAAPSQALPRNRVLVGDARRLLQDLPAHSADCVVTSPPYFLLRDYGVPGQIGLEDSVGAWVDELCLVMRGIARVLKPTGTLWLNLGDTYSRHLGYGAPPKSLLLGPERLALALVEDGWVLRNKLIWAKTNPMPSSVGDRLSCTWEVVYVLARSGRYFFDLDAIRVPPVSRTPRASSTKHTSRTPGSTRPPWAGPLAGSNVGLARLKAAGRVGHPLGKNPGDVWTLPASNYRGGHYATFNELLVRRMLLAGCPEQVCSSCGSPWQRATRRLGALAVRGELRPTCPCRRPMVPGLVLDPFFGVGTVGLVGESLGRDWLGIELNDGFAQIARERIESARNGRERIDAAA